MSREKAIASALRLLNYRWHTEQEIVKKLEAKGYDFNEITTAVKYLKEMGYIDDERYVEQWISDRKRLKPMGRIRITQELQSKGVDRGLVDRKLSEKFSQQEEYEMAVSLAKEKLRCQSRVQWRKLASFLARRGFSGEIISRVGRELDINR